MPKTIFHTTEKSNFILNMDLDKYRAFCVKLIAALLIAVAFSQMVFQLSAPHVLDFSSMIAEGGFGGFLALMAVVFRSVATFFSIFGVFTLIAMVIGMMRMQFSKSTAVPYGITLAMLLWALISVFHSFSIRDALFGQDGRDEGWIAMWFYASLLYLGSMLRRKENLCRMMNVVMGIGLVQCLWGLIQSLPVDFPNEYSFIGPLLYENLHLPSGLTDSPITYAMLLSMLLCIAIPAAICSKEKKQRVFALVSAGFSMLMLLKTQTIASLIGAACAMLLAVVLFVVHHKKAVGKAWLVPTVLACSLAVSGVWVYFTPSINGVYKNPNNQQIDNGFALYDGGIVWDDGFYRLSTASPYNPIREHDFEIEDAGSVLSYAWSEGVRAIKKYPVLGTGPDSFWYMQLRQSMTLGSNVNGVDRPYNDFLFIAATRGILSLVLYLTLLVVCLLRGFRYRKETGSWVYLSAAFAVIAYTATSMVGISVLTVTPLLWVMLGILIGVPLSDPQKPVKAAAGNTSKQPAKKKNASNSKKKKK